MRYSTRWDRKRNIAQVPQTIVKYWPMPVRERVIEIFEGTTSKLVLEKLKLCYYQKRSLMVLGAIKTITQPRWSKQPIIMH